MNQTNQPAEQPSEVMTAREWLKGKDAIYKALTSTSKMLQDYAEYYHAAMLSRPKSAGMSELEAIRNSLYDRIPAGGPNAFGLIQIINVHLKELDEFIDRSRLSIAPEKDACEFAEWASKEEYVYDSNYKVWFDTQEVDEVTYTTAQLYNIFKSKKG